MKIYLMLLVGLLNLTACEAENQDKKDDGNNNGNTIDNMTLVEAVENNDIETVKTLLVQGGNVESKDAQDRSLLMLATHRNNVDIAKILLDAGANVNIQDKIQDSPFLYAGAEGKLELVKLYLSHNPNFGIYNRYGGTALIPAAEKGHLEVVRLLANTPDFPIDHVNNLGWTALMEAVVLGTGGKVHTDIVQALVDAGCDIAIPDSNGVSALSHARNRGFSGIVAILETASKEKK